MRGRTWCVVLAASMLCAGCGSSAQVTSPGSDHVSSSVPSGAVPPDPVDVQGSPTLAEIRKRGTLLVGIRSDAPAFARRSPGGGYSGFDVKVARVLARGLGLDARTQLAFRSLPPTLRVDAVQGGSVDVLLGGFGAPIPELAEVGPYVVTGAPAAVQKHYIGIANGDPVMREKLRGILAGAVADGALQRAIETTLSETGVRARVPDLSR